MPRGKPITAAQEQEFLELVATGKTVTQAAEDLGLSAAPFYKRLADDTDSAFADTFRDEVRPQFRDRIEQTLLDIALGKVKPTHGSQVTALIIALKRYDPEYRESQQHIVSGPGGRAIEVVHADIIDLEIRRLLGELAGRSEAKALDPVAPQALDLPAEDV